MNITVLLFSLLFLVTQAYADIDVFKGPVSVQKGFLTGEEFLKLSERDKVSYTMGIIDGYLSAPMFGAEDKYVAWISTCIKGKTNTQITAILVKYLEDNAVRWDKSVQFLMFEALKKACGEQSLSK